MITVSLVTLALYAAVVLVAAFASGWVSARTVWGRRYAIAMMIIHREMSKRDQEAAEK